MKNTFYRPELTNVSEFEEIISKMRSDLLEWRSETVTEAEKTEYVQKLIADGKPLANNPGMVFWGLDEPEKLPSDARVRYFYIPTYIAVSILIDVMLNGPEKARMLGGVQETLQKGLLAAVGRNFRGHGFDDLAGLIDCLEIFTQVDSMRFIKTYADLCPEFKDSFHQAISMIRKGLHKGSVRGDYGDDYTERAACIVKKIDRENKNMKLFVYGTLLRGNGNHDQYLANSKFLGEAVLHGYAMYSIGSFPGIKRKDKGIVKGEVYEVDTMTIESINILENEGSLFSLKSVSVEMNGNVIDDVGIYEYLLDVKEENYVEYNAQPWGRPISSRNNLVWYVGYGSNMLYERFLCYINGGRFRNNGRNHKKCSDSTPPRAKMLYQLPYEMYYGNRSGSWDDLGVSFLDITASGSAYGVAYLITREQFEHLYLEENGGRAPSPDSFWYNSKVALGTFDGIPIMTITNSRVVTKCGASKRYLNVLEEGLKENYSYLSINEIREYLNSKNNN